MPARRLLAALLLAVTTSVAGLSAQWPRYKRPTVPRLPDGTVNLAAPAPRWLDGKPDLSGVWENIGWREGAIASGIIVGVGGAPSTRSATDRRERAPGIAAFFDIGTMVPGGLPYQPWAKALRDRRANDNAKDNPDAHCLPMGNMQLHLHPEPRKIIQSTHELVVLYEGNAGVRQIFTDGRTLPTGDPQPWWFGYSVGRWEGDTLVVQTNGLQEGMWLDRRGSPISEAAKMTERFRRVNFGLLEIELTVDDPREYTRPWTVTLRQRIVVDTELMDFHCSDNERAQQGR